MPHDYQSAVASLYALGHELAPGTPRRKWELSHMRTLCAALGNPQHAFPSILIAGTNGKGSTAATLASILQISGLRTGLYTSPHLERINERVRINVQIADHLDIGYPIQEIKSVCLNFVELYRVTE